MPGWSWSWCAEIEKFPCAVLAQRHPQSINLGDVSANDFAERALQIVKPDIVVFGSPCQSFSVAGKRLGLDDPRGNLALVALGVLARVRPAWFCFENVPGLFSSAGGRDFGLFLRAVDELGYSLAWSVLDAQWFGLAQRRERVFAVGHLGDWRAPAAVLFEPESLQGHSPPSRQAGQRVAAVLTAGSPNGSGYRNAADSDTLVAAAFDARQSNVIQYGPIAGPLDTDGHSQAVAFSSKDHGADAGEVAPTLRAMGHAKSHANAGGQVAVAFTLHGASKTKSTGTETDIAGAIRARPPGSIENSSTTVALTSSAVRRLTPRECERLQGYPDDYTLVTYRKKPAADGPRYKALGNSMAVPVVRWILTRIELVSRLRNAA